MKTKNPKIADVREALSGKQLSRSQTMILQGGNHGRFDLRNMYPYILDTDRP